MEIKVRPAELDDFDHVFRLFKQLWPGQHHTYHSQLDVYERSIVAQSDSLLLVEINNEILGFGSMIIMNNFWQESRIGYITTLIVDEQYRGIGIGKHLLNELIHIAREMNCKKIELDSGIHRAEAHKFYETMGFMNRALLFSLDL